MKPKNMEFFNNKGNDSLKFKLNSQGIDTTNVEPRLILKNKDNKNYLFYGKVVGETCVFDVPELSLYEQGETGEIKFEIICEDVYFSVWNENFEIKTKASIKIDEMVTEKREEIKPKFSVSFEKTEPVKETVKETIKEPVQEEKILETKKTEKVPEKKVTKESVMSFDKFFVKK